MNRYEHLNLKLYKLYFFFSVKKNQDYVWSGRAMPSWYAARSAARSSLVDCQPMGESHISRISFPIHNPNGLISANRSTANPVTGLCIHSLKNISFCLEVLSVHCLFTLLVSSMKGIYNFLIFLAYKK